jgi:hypothetical protein
MTSIFGQDFTLTIGDERVPLKEFSFKPVKPWIDPTVDDLVSASTYTTTIILDDVENLSPLTDEEQEKMRVWWTARLHDELERQICGVISEYQHSLRAAGSKV